MEHGKSYFWSDFKIGLFDIDMFDWMNHVLSLKYLFEARQLKKTRYAIFLRMKDK